MNGIVAHRNLSREAIVIVTAGLNPSFVIAENRISRREAGVAMGFSVTRNTYEHG
jgi:hypothetical protein